MGRRRDRPTVGATGWSPSKCKVAATTRCIKTATAYIGTVSTDGRPAGRPYSEISAHSEKTLENCSTAGVNYGKHENREFCIVATVNDMVWEYSFLRERPFQPLCVERYPPAVEYPETKFDAVQVQRGNQACVPGILCQAMWREVSV
jgi:hypothetical protein